MEQLITGGKADAASSIAGGLINAVSGAIYGNNPLGSLKEAFIKGAKAGAATSGISYLSEVFGGQDGERRSGTLRGSLGLVPFGRANDPRHGCMARDPWSGAHQTSAGQKDAPALVKKIGEMTYVVRVHFSETRRGTMSDKIKRMLKNEIA